MEGRTRRLIFKRVSLSPEKLSGKIWITSLIHGILVQEKSKPKNALVTHRIQYDQTVDGIELIDHPAYSMQYHPETVLGSRDASYMFGRFLEKMKIWY